MCNKTPVSARKPNVWRKKEPLITIRLLFNPRMFLGEFLSLQRCPGLQYIRFAINSWFSLMKSIYKVSQVLLFNTSSKFRCMWHQVVFLPWSCWCLELHWGRWAKCTFSFLVLNFSLRHCDFIQEKCVFALLLRIIIWKPADHPMEAIY